MKRGGEWDRPALWKSSSWPGDNMVCAQFHLLSTRRLPAHVRAHKGWKAGVVGAAKEAASFRRASEVTTGEGSNKEQCTASH